MRGSLVLTYAICPICKQEFDARSSTPAGPAPIWGTTILATASIRLSAASKPHKQESSDLARRKKVCSYASRL